MWTERSKLKYKGYFDLTNVKEAKSIESPRFTVKDNKIQLLKFI